MTKPLCIYHGNCADGFTAAWAVHRALGNDADYNAGVYQDPPPDVKGRDVVIVDFSYKRPVLQEMRKSARSILVLDHHKSAAEDLAAGDGFIDISGWTPPNDWERHLRNAQQDIYEGAHQTIYTFFDMERSGAGIAWDFFHGPEPRPRLVDYAEDRDLWRFKLPFSRDISAFVFAHDYTFDVWESLARQLASRFDMCVDMGAAIEKKHHKDVAELVKTLKRDMTIGGFRVPVANLPYTLTSDAGHLMCSEWNGDLFEDSVTARPPPFAACYWDTPKGRVFSLRSVGDFDVSAIAATYGGGGHKNAAGFTLPHGASP